MIKSTDLQNRVAAPESIRGEHAVQADLDRVKSRRGHHDFSLAEIADVLDHDPRTGSDEDEPEGARVVTISDTLAKCMAAALRGHVCHPQ